MREVVNRLYFLLERIENIMQSLPKGKYRYELLSILNFVFKLITKENHFSVLSIWYK